MPEVTLSAEEAPGALQGRGKRQSLKGLGLGVGHKGRRHSRQRAGVCSGSSGGHLCSMVRSGRDTCGGQGNVPGADSEHPCHNRKVVWPYP